MLTYAAEGKSKGCAEGGNRLERLALSILDNEQRLSDGYIDAVGDEARQAECMRKLCRAGYDIGFNYVRKMAQRFYLGPMDSSTAMRFISTAFWSGLFGRQLHELGEDAAGNFLYMDADFTWLHPERFLKKDAAYELLSFPCGAITGALASLGFKSVVDVDRRGRTALEFTVRIIAEG